MKANIAAVRSILFTTRLPIHRRLFAKPPQIDTFPAGCVASVIGLEATVVVGQEDIKLESGSLAAALNT
jgi:hypothetical protein